MKTIFKTLALGALTLAAASCDQLVSETYGAYNSSTFPKTEADIKALLVGSVYEPFQSNQYAGLWCNSNRSIWVYNDMCTDILNCAWQDPMWSDLINVNFNNIQVEGPALLYRNNINTLTRMSNCIRTIEATNLDKDVKDGLIAQARCGRGWMTYLLYDLYGGLQLPTEEVMDNPAGNVIVPRSSAEETAKYAEEDLLFAAKNLPARYHYGEADYGRFTAALAYTALMKLYMHDKRWTDAVECGKELMKPEYGFDLVRDYKDIFTLENEGNNETIFALCEDHGITIQNYLSQVLPSNYPTKNPNIVAFGGYKMQWSFYRTFEKGDRRLLTICAEYTTTSGLIRNEKTPGVELELGVVPIKYGEDPEDTGSGSAIDQIVYRFADVLTMQAEALARVANAPTQDAVDLLNRVRTRAGLSEKKLSDFPDLGTFLNAVLTERGHEGWCEGWRRPDLIRHDKFIAYAKLYKKSRTAEPYMVLFPIPQECINEGRGIILQNPGY